MHILNTTTGNMTAVNSTAEVNKTNELFHPTGGATYAEDKDDGYLYTILFYIFSSECNENTYNMVYNVNISSLLY